MPALPIAEHSVQKTRNVTECSGLEPLPYVLDRLGLISGPSQLVKDITRRRPEQLPDHDLYVVGFPCQPFSTMGSSQVLDDPFGRGLIIEHIIAALATKLPRAT